MSNMFGFQETRRRRMVDLKRENAIQCASRRVESTWKIYKVKV